MIASTIINLCMSIILQLITQITKQIEMTTTVIDLLALPQSLQGRRMRILLANTW